MKLSSLAAALALAAVPLMATTVLAQQGQQDSPPPIVDPQQFADSAASSNTFEIESSELAINTSQNEEVVAFAEQMVTDHTAAGEQMMAAAEEDGITPASEMEELHQTQIEELSALQGEEFDQAYIAAQVAAHRSAVALFESFSTDGQESALKSFAAETLPTLEQHLEHITQMAEE
ncbi:DUF4142 domain-containing protein [Pelagibacterium sp. H642]|uniref:DUF4142 domain-containing protein n=1 Tax=Pelagibacterium sp. H642 TaxID=1881069 RepID=UPI002814B262|nr:DUF4142 domain-containing protein [Pelagibacterium sp. H642]WMT92816.1 DUF4142 domain-containing protein [Pelagibacterium sp. H642]